MAIGKKWRVFYIRMLKEQKTYLFNNGLNQGIALDFINFQKPPFVMKWVKKEDPKYFQSPNRKLEQNVDLSEK